jgi:hypothetical protein
MSDASFSKTCGCGRVHDEPSWTKLAFAYVQEFEWGEKHEARDCDCGSTIVRVIDEGDYEAYERCGTARVR